MDDISDEPALCGVAQSRAEAGSNGIWGEPALVDTAAADAERSSHRAWLAEQWARTSAKTRFVVFFLLCAFSGLAAIPCAVLKESFGYGALLIVVAAPVAEEMAKAILPLMVLEKRPWFFGSYLSIVLVGLLSGAVFASVENALYFFVYIPSEKLTQGTILWRLVVCTAMHVGCAALACSGLARAWSRARERLAEFEMSVAMPRLIAAVIIHGVYNLGALIFAILSR